MNGNSPRDLSQLCIHSITTKPWNIEMAAEHFAAAGVPGISVWRDALEGRNIAETGQFIRDRGLSIVSLCRGGFFPSADRNKRREAIQDNLRAVDEAAALGAPLIVLVCGADPSQSLIDSRSQIREGIEALLPAIQAAGIKLAIEPLHPMYADTRSAINTLKQANEMAEAIAHPAIGVAVDVYHCWWDPELEAGIRRCGAEGHLFAYHVCDWNVPTSHFLLDRGLMGEGCIPLKEITRWIESTGFAGFYEVEIFSEKFWAMDQSLYLKKIINAYQENV